MDVTWDLSIYLEVCLVLSVMGGRLRHGWDWIPPSTCSAPSTTGPGSIGWLLAFFFLSYLASSHFSAINRLTLPF